MTPDRPISELFTLQRPLLIKGEPGTGGEHCPYLEHEPMTDAGWAAWDVLTRAAGQLRIAPNGLVLGLDRGGPGESEKGEDIDLNGFGVQVWGNRE